MTRAAWAGAAALLLAALIGGFVLFTSRDPAEVPDSEPPPRTIPAAAPVAEPGLPPTPIRAAPEVRPARASDAPPDPGQRAAGSARSRTRPDEKPFVPDPDPRCRITGRVLGADGTPVAGARLDVENSLMSHRRVSDIEGRFAFDNLFPVRTQVHALLSLPGALWIGRSAEVTLVGGEARDGLDVRLPADPDVTVDVRDDEDRPVGGQRLAPGLPRDLLDWIDHGPFVTD